CSAKHHASRHAGTNLNALFSLQEGLLDGVGNPIARKGLWWLRIDPHNVGPLIVFRVIVLKTSLIRSPGDHRGAYWALSDVEASPDWLSSLLMEVHLFRSSSFFCGNFCFANWTIDNEGLVGQGRLRPFNDSSMP